MLPVPFGDMDDILRAMEDLSQNQTQAVSSARLRLGVYQEKTYAPGAASRRYGGVLSVLGQAGSAYEDLEDEFRKVYTVLQQQGGFGKRRTTPLFCPLQLI